MSLWLKNQPLMYLLVHFASPLCYFVRENEWENYRSHVTKWVKHRYSWALSSLSSPLSSQCRITPVVGGVNYTHALLMLISVEQMDYFPPSDLSCWFRSVFSLSDSFWTVLTHYFQSAVQLFFWCLFYLFPINVMVSAQHVIIPWWYVDRWELHSD